tara:strand:- start:151436 stop:151717 length:282 start_codon:yes stop_codon:yes gene_type:complete
VQRKSELEWEAFATRREIQEFDSLGPLSPGTDSATIERDDSYDLDVRFSGVPAPSDTSPFADPIPDSPAGTILEGETVSGEYLNAISLARPLS